MHALGQKQPDERADWEQLHEQILTVKSNVTFKELNAASSENVAILNTHRQIVFITRSCLDLFGINDPAEVYGCRIGEIMQCTNSDNGCGNSKMCKFCGANHAIRISLAGRADSRNVCITNKHTGEKHFLLVASAPIILKGEAFALLSLSEKQ